MMREGANETEITLYVRNRFEFEINLRKFEYFNF